RAIDQALRRKIVALAGERLTLQSKVCAKLAFLRRRRRDRKGAHSARAHNDNGQSPHFFLQRARVRVRTGVPPFFFVLAAAFTEACARSFAGLTASAWTASGSVAPAGG